MTSQFKTVVAGTLVAAGCGQITSLGTVQDTDAGGMSANDAGARCDLPEPPSSSTPTQQDTERAALVHEYCLTLARDGCLDVLAHSFIIAQTTGCSIEGRTRACELDRLYERAVYVAPACEDEWQAAVRCATHQTYDPVLNCPEAQVFIFGGGAICEAEKNALLACTSEEDLWQEVSGARATCSFGTGVLGECSIGCTVAGDQFHANCGGPAGLPLRCFCSPSGEPGGGDVFGTFYASDCQDAAQRLAEGEWCTK